MSNNNEIMNTADMIEQDEEGNGPETNMVATREAEGNGIEFHVSMRSYTQHDMEGLIVDAAARVLVGQYGNNKLAKLVEERCMALTTAKVDAHLKTVVADIIDQPVTPQFPFQSKPTEQPVTMREFIGLTGQAFLQARVGNDGQPQSISYSTKPRIQYLVERTMADRFKTEIEKASNALLAEIRNTIAAEHKAFLEKEKVRFREALAKYAS